MNSDRKIPNRALNEARQALAARIAKWPATEETHISECPASEGLPEPPVPGLLLHNNTKPSGPGSYLLQPSFCLVVQGAKQVRLNEEDYLYDANQYLITSVNLPIIVNVIEASPERPFLGLTWTLDLRVVAQLIADGDLPPLLNKGTERGVAVGAVTPELLNTLVRLLDLLDTPEDIPILAPLIHKELIYRLLTGDQGDRLRQIVKAKSHPRQISRAIDWLLENYHRTVRMEELASLVGMSTSSLHHHFRSVTSMSPLQYQKSIRLQEARRLMLSENKDAASAGTLVGYESPSQFSREYSRMFGAPPKRDIKRLREMNP